MTNQASGDESRWLQAPLESKEVRILVAVADDAELSPAMRAALEQLAVAMQTEQAEVAGYLMDGCSCHGGFSCTTNVCKQSQGLGARLLSPVSAPMSFGILACHHRD